METEKEDFIVRVSPYFGINTVEAGFSKGDRNEIEELLVAYRNELPKQGIVVYTLPRNNVEKLVYSLGEAEIELEREKKYSGLKWESREDFIRRFIQLFKKKATNRYIR